MNVVVDHILFMKMDQVLLDSIHVNPGEVAAIDFVDPQDTLSDRPITPWLAKIKASGLLQRWTADFLQRMHDPSHENAHSDETLIKTSFSDAPIIQLT